MQISLQSPNDPFFQPSNFVSQCLQQYEQKLNEENEFSQYDSEQDPIPPEQILADEESLKYYGYEDKKSITIKPIKMHKDLISLRKENAEKRKVIQELEKQNAQLKSKYGASMKENQKVEKFLKDIEFTFKNDKKAQKANQIMLKAKKMLYRQAVECQNNAKKITKGAQANSVQEIKMYIEFLEAEKERLKKMIETKKKENQIKRQEEDFNAQNEQKFQQTLQRVQKMLNIQMRRTRRHHEVYKIQKGMVCTGLKEKQIMLKKKYIQKYYQKLKDLMLKKQGEEYEIVVLQKKRKDKIKLIEEMKQFKNDITFKKSSIQQLEKELKEKMKTYDYMSKWTKELKVKLQEKKEHHITNKISFEKKINALSREFEEWNKKYKLQLVEQQLGSMNSNANNNRKKGTNNPNPTSKDIYLRQNSNSLNKDYLSNSNRQSTQGLSKKAKLIKIQEVRKIVKKIKVWLLFHEINLEDFLKTKILDWKQPKQDTQKENSQEKISSTVEENSGIGDNFKLLLAKDKNILANIFSSTTKKPQPLINDSKKKVDNESNSPSQENVPSITLKQLFDKFKSQILILSQQPTSQIMKLARYVVQDSQNTISSNFNNTIKTSDGYVPNLSISKKLAFTIMRKLFENELTSREEIEQTKVRLREFLTKFYDPFRYDILKQLLQMDGLKGIQREKTEDEKGMTNSSLFKGQITQGSKCQNSPQSNNSQMMSNMKRNQQLHLQLQLDDEIFMRKLKKHVVQEYYVSRFKEVFDLMIYEEFGETDRPRLGMFDKVCEILTEKKLIKENVTRDYNFETIKSFDQCERKEKKKDEQENKRKDGFKREQLPGQTQIVIKTQKDGQEGDYWFSKPEKLQKRISGVDIKETQKNSKHHIKDHIKEDTYHEQVRSNGSRQKNWIDDLMSDGNDSVGQIEQNHSFDSQSDD